MIYLKNISTPQVLYVPKCREHNGDLMFSIKSTINQLVAGMSVVDELGNGLYFKLEIMLPKGIESGEYEYYLTDDVGVLSEGILVVGEFLSSKEYEKVIQYEHY